MDKEISKKFVMFVLAVAECSFCLSVFLVVIKLTGERIYGRFTFGLLSESKSHLKREILTAVFF